MSAQQQRRALIGGAVAATAAACFLLWRSRTKKPAAVPAPAPAAAAAPTPAMHAELSRAAAAAAAPAPAAKPAAKKPKAKAKPKAAPAPAPPPAASPAEPTAEEQAAAARKAAQNAVTAEFHIHTSKAGKLHKKSEWAAAAVAFGEAIEVMESHSEWLGDNREALFNNRAAMYEKAAGAETSVDEKAHLLNLSLSDCDEVLLINRKHVKVHRRRARVFADLGNKEAALTELFAIVLIERERVTPALMAAVQAGAGGEEIQRMQSAPPEQLEPVMLAVGSARAEAVFKKREVEGYTHPMPSAYAVTQLLMTYSAHSLTVAQAGGAGQDAAALDTAVAEAEAGGDAGALAEALKARGKKRTVQRQYEAAAVDFDRALTAATEAGGADGCGDAELWRWVGLYRHLLFKLDLALEAYETAISLEPSAELRAETLIKKSGVMIDREQLDAAAVLLEEAAAVHPGNADVHMHRAQLWVIKHDLEKSRSELETCLSIAPEHALAHLRLATVLMHTGDVPAAGRALDLAAELAPEFAEVHQVKGELALAQQRFPDALELFDKAIALDPANPIPYVDKGLTLMQSDPYKMQTAIELFETAIAHDPQCMLAYMRLSELKLQMSASFEQAEAVLGLLNTAEELCREREELAELCTMKAVTEAQILAAKALGMESFRPPGGV